MTIEEKAKAYDEAIKKAKYYYDEGKTLGYAIDIVSNIFPELKESEGEVMRKKLLELVAQHCGKTCEMYLWLEKQGEQKDVNIQINPSEYINNMGGNGCYLKNTAQNLSDKVEPKFKQGDIIKEKETGNLFYVNSIEDFGYTLHYKDCIAKGCTMDFKYEDDYELMEQKPACAWSEEDESMRTRCIGILGKCYMGELPTKVEEELNWLKSLKNRYTWKPSDEQMDTLEYYMHTLICNEHKEVLFGLYADLKKLKE